MRADQPEEWKAKVRACRVVDITARPGQLGVGSSALRKTAIVQLLQTMSQTVGVLDDGGVQWRGRKQFIKWALNTDETDNVEEAVELWNKRINDPSAKKRQDPGDEVRLAVRRMPETTFYR